MVKLHRDSVLGLICIAVSLLLILVWIPLDTDTGIVEKVRRHVALGDALAPTFAGLFVLLGGLMLTLQAEPDASRAITGRNFGFLARLLLLLVVSTVLMRWSGPLCVAASNALTGEELSYRLLRDTAPWKYIGFVIGGMTLVAGLITLVRGRLTVRTIVIALATVAVLIALYDLPFDDLLLPPNGDV